MCERLFRGILIAVFGVLPYFSICAVLPEQLLSQKNDIYIVKEKIDLKGDTLIFPAERTLRFKGGHICNGRIIFNSTKIANQPKFRNCSYEGSVIIDRIDDRGFTSTDDIETFRFLLKNAIELGVRCEIHRDYTISMKDVSSSVGVISIHDIDSGAEINFNNHTISNTHPFLFPQIKPIFRFLNVKNVTIRDCNFHDADENNTHNFKKSAGCTFVHCLGDCESINLQNCSQENGDCILRSGVYTHDDKHPEYTPSRGLSNSILQVKSRNVGYGLALYCGDNLTIDIDTDSPHRGFYCTGVSNSIIKYRGSNPVETKTHILIKDAVCRNVDAEGTETLDMRGCSNLSIKAHVPMLNSGEQILCLQSYGTGLKENADFRFRKEMCHHKDIDFTARIDKYPNEIFYIICNISSDSGALDENDIIGCKVTGIKIHDINNIGGQATRYMCCVSSHSDVDMNIDNCHVYDRKRLIDEKTFDFQIIGTSKGRILINNSDCGNILVRKKTMGNFYIEGKGKTHFNGNLSYIDDGSNKNLVKIVQKN